LKDIRMYLDPLDPNREVRVEEQWISDQAYAEVARKMVVLCTDAVFTTSGDKAIYLTKRSVYPMKGIWWFGGRLFFNDASPEDAISRAIQRETAHHINPARFRFISIHGYAWVKTAQGDFGCKNFGLTYQCEVDDVELDLMRSGLIASEYDRSFGIQRFDRERLVAENVHQALIDVYDDLFA